MGNTLSTGLDQPTMSVPVSVSVAPYLSVLALLADSAGARRRFGETVTSQRGREAVRPLSAPGCGRLPDTVVPVPPRADVTVAEQLAALDAAGDDLLARDLAQAFGARVPGYWQEAARHPRRWLDGYREAGTQAWEVLRPLWRRAEGLLQREIERVGVAVARGCSATLLADLDPRLAGVELHGRRIVLVPMLSGPGARIASYDQDGAVWIGYPLPGLGQVWCADRPEQRREDTTDLVLGPHRALILRALDRPANMRGLTATLHYTPSALTYQCTRLEQAGLVRRERRGREMLVSRTERGSALLDLLTRG